MRLGILACGLGALALTALSFPSDPAAAAKTKMGCERGKEVWSATTGKCVPGKSKAKMAASKATKKKAAPRKAAAPKVAPEAAKSAPAEKSPPAETKK